MADQGSGAIFGFDDSNITQTPSFDDKSNPSSSTGPNTTAASTTPSASTTTSTTAAAASAGPPAHQDDQFFFDPSSWSYQDTPGQHSFDFVSSGPSPPTLLQSASWDFPSPQVQQHQQQHHHHQQQGSPVTAGGFEHPSNPGFFPNPGSLTTNTTPNSNNTATLPTRQGPPPQPTQNPPVPRPLNLTPAQQEKLRSIAMPAHLQYHSPRSEPSPGSATSDAKGGMTGALSSPDGADHSSKANSRKRKSSADVEDEDDEEDPAGGPIKKTAHNMIEKRYRTNLNDKIAALRDSVPSLRIMSKSARGEDTTEDREELHGLTPAHKLNKATVLSKATEYIRHLEKRNNRLLDENGAMHARIAAFEKLFMAGAMTGAMSPMQQPPTPMQYPQDQYMTTPPMSTPQGDATQGMIQVPDDIRRLVSAQMVGQPYPVPQQPYGQRANGNPTLQRQQQVQQQQQQQMQQGQRWGNAGPYFGKLMVGSLAGLMIIEAARTEEQSTETPEGRGLFALPVQLLRYLGSNSHVHIAGHPISIARLISHLKLILCVGIVLWVFLPSFFGSSKKQKKGIQESDSPLQAAPSLASPIHVRRQAWLTAIQTVWVPEHNLFLEAAALIVKTMKLSLRNAIGIHGYQMLTGLTEDQEVARVKAWSIALDAQLAGGDVEISKSRLTLTLLASGTLPDTPLRLMLKALHIRVLIWDLGAKGLHNTIATKLAKSRWNEAKQLNRLLVQTRRTSGQAHDDELPEHLAALLDHECHVILNNDVIQRAYNLAWNLPTTENVAEDNDGMDAVVDDHAVRSPMDAVAAWWSSQEAQRALTENLAAETDDPVSQQTVEGHLREALRAAPIASTAQARALVARAVLVDEKRGESIASALQTVQPTRSAQPLATDTNVTALESVPTETSLDVQVALSCATAIARLHRADSFSPPRGSVQLVEKIAQPGVTATMSLLGCTALFKLMTELHSHPKAVEAFGSSLERLAGSLRIWIGSTPGEKCGLDQDVRHRIVDQCLGITKTIVGMETDTGYGSMSECEDELGC